MTKALKSTPVNDLYDIIKHNGSYAVVLKSDHSNVQLSGMKWMCDDFILINTGQKDDYPAE